MSDKRPENWITLKEILPPAERGRYAVGSFSLRYTAMVRPILRAGQALRSPLIVQISQNEFGWFGNSPEVVAAEFQRCLVEEAVTVPVVLHLDHTKELGVIEAAIRAGFTSVMIDASAKPLAENIAITRQVVELAHAHGVSVEAELGRITTTDKLETDDDVEMYTRPEEAQVFVRETGVDALAVSVGTAHGVYTVRQPKIDYDRLMAIRALTPVHLVLHGGSGIPPEMMRRAYRLPGGGVSEINIATDLELAALAALGGVSRMTDAEMSALPAARLELAREAVRQTVVDKITYFLDSKDKA